jgi:hypothetical protein
MRDLAGECPIPGAQLVIAHVDGALDEREEADGAVGMGHSPARSRIVDRRPSLNSAANSVFQ